MGETPAPLAAEEDAGPAAAAAPSCLRSAAAGTVVVVHRGSSCPFAASFLLQVVDVLDTLALHDVNVTIVSTEVQDALDTAKALGLARGACGCGGKGGGLPTTTNSGISMAESKGAASALPPGVQGAPQFDCEGGTCSIRPAPRSGALRPCVCLADVGGIQLARLGLLANQPNPLISWRGLLCTAFGGGHAGSIPSACPAVVFLDKQHRVLWRYVAEDYRAWPDSDQLAAQLDEVYDIPELLQQVDFAADGREQEVPSRPLLGLPPADNGRATNQSRSGTAAGLSDSPTPSASAAAAPGTHAPGKVSPLQGKASPKLTPAFSAAGDMSAPSAQHTAWGTHTERVVAAASVNPISVIELDDSLPA
jgi:hypothetical protein